MRATAVLTRLALELPYVPWRAMGRAGISTDFIIGAGIEIKAL